MTRTSVSKTKLVAFRFEKGDIERLHRLSQATGLQVSSLVRLLISTAEATGHPAICFGTGAAGKGTGDAEGSR